MIPTGLLDTLYAANVLWHASGELESHDNANKHKNLEEGGS